MTQLRRALFGLWLPCLLCLPSFARAEAIGTFTSGIIVIDFAFDPATFVPDRFGLGIAGAGRYISCEIELFVDGVSVSRAFVPNPRFGCQGSWLAGPADGGFFTIDGDVDLTGVAAGRPARLVLYPLIDPGSTATLDVPTLELSPGPVFTSATNVEILPPGSDPTPPGPVVPAPVPLPLAILGLFAAGLVAVGLRARQGRTLA